MDKTKTDDDMEVTENNNNNNTAENAAGDTDNVVEQEPTQEQEGTPEVDQDEQAENADDQTQNMEQENLDKDASENEPASGGQEAAEEQVAQGEPAQGEEAEGEALESANAEQADQVEEMEQGEQVEKASESVQEEQATAEGEYEEQKDSIGNTNDEEEVEKENGGAEEPQILSLEDPTSDGEPAVAEEGDAEELEDRVTPVVELSPASTQEADVIDLLDDAYDERAQLKTINEELEAKLIQLQRFKALTKPNSRGLTSSIVTDLEARYNSSLLTWSDYVKEEQRVAKYYDSAIMDLRFRIEEKDNKAFKLEEDYISFRREVIKSAEYTRTGKTISNHVIRDIQAIEDEKEREKGKNRLQNIQLLYQLRDLEIKLKQKEELAEGLHLIDFEQLKIENQSLNEKIEERNEELLKLRKKTTTTVQVLTHLKEKLQFVQKKNDVLAKELLGLDTDLSSKRDKLQKEKHLREKARDDILKLRERSGLVTDQVLLQDVDKQKQKREYLINKVEELQRHYNSMSQQLV